MTARQVDLLLDERARLVHRNLMLRGELTKQELWMSAAIKALTRKTPTHEQRMEHLALAQQGREILAATREVCAPTSTDEGRGGDAAVPMAVAGDATPPSPVQGY